MTQNTQTTAERIRNLIFDAIQDSPYGDESIVAAPLGVTIAAEIDRLAAERDEAQRLIGIYGTSRDAVIAQLGTEIDRLTAEAEAARQGRYQEHDRVVELRGQLNAARAEVERLRPLAEAWLYKQACEAWDAGRITPFEFAEAHKLYSPQARRAREARGGA